MLNTMEALNRQIAAGVLDYEKAWSFALREDRERRARERGPNLERKRRERANERDKAKFVDASEDTSRDVTSDSFSERDTAAPVVSRHDVDGKVGFERKNNREEGLMVRREENLAPPPKPLPTYAELLEIAKALADEHVGRTYSREGFAYQVREFATFFTEVSRKTKRVPEARNYEVQARIWMNRAGQIKESNEAYPLVPPSAAPAQAVAEKPAAPAEAKKAILVEPVVFDFETEVRSSLPPEEVEARRAQAAAGVRDEEVLDASWARATDFLVSTLKLDDMDENHPSVFMPRLFLAGIVGNEAHIVAFHPAWLLIVDGVIDTLAYAVAREWPSVTKIIATYDEEFDVPIDELDS